MRSKFKVPNSLKSARKNKKKNEGKTKMFTKKNVSIR